MSKKLERTHVDRWRRNEERNKKIALDKELSVIEELAVYDSAAAKALDHVFDTTEVLPSESARILDRLAARAQVDAAGIYLVKQPR